MDEIERRLIRVEEQIGQMAQGLSRVESAIIRMAESVQELARTVERHEQHGEEIMRLRSHIHEHAQVIARLPGIEARLGRIEEQLQRTTALAVRAAVLGSVLAGLVMLLVRLGVG